MPRKTTNEELNRLTAEEFKQAAKMPIVAVLDNVRSLNNIGSVFRTADAFLLQAVYLCGITAQPPHREIAKTALGATETVDWLYFADTTDAINKLKSEGYVVLIVEQVEGSVMLNDYLPQPNDKLAVVFGNEVTGVEQAVVDMADTVLEIPQLGTKHSLNISVSAGIVIWDLFCKLAAR